ncbi:alpha/beta hydrolase [Alkanindiges hydrocarboniclasticus]|jgi:pimeloyl-ACP methyl ester carboxylesterase|uniref:Alpha/beta hydrolase n=2 Tax=Alkanindiges hydrocarboniclasticus TaxID=1907941 RepID=A0A1S8CU99_9GAMM|nr:alpha/beta hydrolase [Alkanindiges hydrocarboniclasticus]
MINTTFIFRTTLMSICLAGIMSGCSMNPNKPAALTIAQQGNFAAGGKIITSEGNFDDKQLFKPAGQTLHGDHASVFYQIPENPHPYPLVFLHGAGQSAKTWGTTPDGREGFQTIFLRQHFPVYLVDQPRRGQAGQSTVGAEVPATTNDQAWFNMFRLGRYPNFFKGVQFSQDPQALNQYFRQMTPNTGAYDEQVISDAMVEVLKRSGDAVLITHSQGGGPGWWTAIKSNQVKGIVAYEPGSGFVFPEHELPDPMPSATGTLAATPIKMADFQKLTKIPIIVYYGDNIPTEKNGYAGQENAGQDNWRVRLKMAQLWVDKINQHGGHAQLVHLPDIGIYGNTHFAFSDSNSDQIAQLLVDWLQKNKLD